MKLYAHINGDSFELHLDAERDVIAARSGTKQHSIVLDDQKTSIRTAFIDNRRIEFGWTRDEDAYLILIDGIEYRVEVHNARAEMASKFLRENAPDTAETVIKAPIPGLVRHIPVKEGDVVKKGQTLLTLDAMKLENEISSPRDGKVKSISVKAGMPVEKGQVLVVVGV